MEFGLYKPGSHGRVKKKGSGIMCDTLGRIGAGESLFAKNSDRSPNEIQRLEYRRRQSGLSGLVQCTYISIPQAAETYGVLLSRPSWMWGAEMGVNEWGLCIGNEAVFTTGAYGKTGLTGMDMVRLALERSKTAREALQLLIELLETYGQGGNCGFDHNFYYDNAFLIMDRAELYVLETASKNWVYKKMNQANISNRLSLGTDGDAYSGGTAYDFRKRHTEPVFTTFSGSKARSGQLRKCLPDAKSVGACMQALRCHHSDVKNPFVKGSVSSACMHYGGAVGDHTTSSMVVSLQQEKILVWSTGSSVPCISLFKPWCWGTEPVLPVTNQDDTAGDNYWLEAERFRRSLLGKKIPGEYYAQRDALEEKWLSMVPEVSDFGEFSRMCLQEEKSFYDSWKGYAFESAKCAPGFLNRWEKKTAALKK